MTVSAQGASSVAREPMFRDPMDQLDLTPPRGQRQVDLLTDPVLSVGSRDEPDPIADLLISDRGIIEGIGARRVLGCGPKPVPAPADPLRLARSAHLIVELLEDVPSADSTYS